MSVHPGFGAQEFIDTALDKLAQAAAHKRAQKLAYSIEVDGGVKMYNAERVAAAGAEILVSGSGIFGTPSYAETIAMMRRSAERGAAERR